MSIARIRISTGIPPVVLLAAISLGSPAGPATAATTDIGAVSEIGAGTAPYEPSSGGYTVQLGEATGTYAVPDGYGVISAWSHSTGTATGVLVFKVYRPRGSGGEFLTVAADARTVAAKSVPSFPVRIPVRPGDRLGLSSEVGGPQLAFESGNAGDKFGFFPPDVDPAPGSTVALDGPPGDGFKLDVAARVESDRDGDGFGDDSQDGCATSAATQGACPPGALPAFAGCPALAANLLLGTGGRNRISGTRRADRIFAGTGDDAVDALAGDDCVDLEPGADRGDGGSGDDLLLGRSGGDRLSGSRGRDRIGGGSGRDGIGGGSGNDRIDGDAGNDRLTGGPGRDRIRGSSGNDRVSARDGARDSVSCGAGRDTVSADRIDRISRSCERVRRDLTRRSKHRR